MKLLEKIKAFFITPENPPIQPCGVRKVGDFVPFSQMAEKQYGYKELRKSRKYKDIKL